MTQTSTLFGVAALALAMLWTITPAHGQRFEFGKDTGEGKLADDLKKWHGGKGPTPPPPSTPPRPTSGQGQSIAAQVGRFDLNGIISAAHPLNLYPDEATCLKDLEAKVIAPTRRMVLGRDRVWTVNNQTFLEWGPDRFGRNGWQFTVYGCGPSAPTPELILEKMGVDVVATIEQGIKQIKARGYKTE